MVEGEVLLAVKRTNTVAREVLSSAVVSLLKKLKVIGPLEFDVSDTEDSAVMLDGLVEGVIVIVRGAVHVFVVVLNKPTQVIISAFGSPVIKLLAFNFPPL